MSDNKEIPNEEVPTKQSKTEIDYEKLNKVCCNLFQFTTTSIILAFNSLIFISTILYLATFYYYFSSGSDLYLNVPITTNVSAEYNVTLYAALYFTNTTYTDNSDTKCNNYYFPIPYHDYCLDVYDTSYNTICVNQEFNKQVNLNDFSCEQLKWLNGLVGLLPYTGDGYALSIFAPNVTAYLIIICLAICTILVVLSSISFHFTKYNIITNILLVPFIIIIVIITTIIGFYGAFAYFFTNWLDFLVDATVFYYYIPSPTIELNFIQELALNYGLDIFYLQTIMLLYIPVVIIVIIINCCLITFNMRITSDMESKV